ncbi:hypothetical protein PTE30175_04708 [Pandoraea terrae]|uniref:Uncharacterized protein n=1 Tax=Pandoraea terrae TaxID=1537710 RepID=A0A5E4YXE4_9BURK|nr:hypothetical protein PTE30175_04708 [Pandoraea terrae]
MRRVFEPTTTSRPARMSTPPPAISPPRFTTSRSARTTTLPRVSCPPAELAEPTEPTGAKEPNDPNEPTDAIAPVFTTSRAATCTSASPTIRPLLLSVSCASISTSRPFIIAPPVTAPLASSRTRVPCAR